MAEMKPQSSFKAFYTPSKIVTIILADSDRFTSELEWLEVRSIGSEWYQRK